MLPFLLSLFLATAAQSTAFDDERVLGRVSEHSAALISTRGGMFYGISLTPRDGNLCQIRAYFEGESPRTAEYCSGRVVSRHFEETGISAVHSTQAVEAISACFSGQTHIAALGLTDAAGERVSTRAAACDSDFQTVSCRSGWAVQGLHLYFDGPADGRRHRRLVGLRPLCAQL